MIGLGVASIGLWIMNTLTAKKVQASEKQATTIQQELQTITATDHYQKIAFAQSLHNTSKSLPWSDHIQALIKVLQEMQTIDNANSTLELYDFNVNLDTIEISGKVSSLNLLYYPKSKNKQWLISKVSELEFLDNIRIQSYVKEDGMYTFTLYATILLDETTQQ